MTRHPTSIVRTPLAIGLALLVSSCSTPPPKPAAPSYEGKAHYQRIPAPAGTHPYTLSPGESYIKPTLRQNPDPVYPVPLIDLALPTVDIVARLSVDRLGRVTAVYISKDNSQALYRQAFEKAVHDAARHWVFTPLRFTTTVTRAHHPPVVKMTSKPFSMWFRFHFEVVNGKPVTSSQGR